MSRKFVQPYLFFGGQCENALAFYSSVVGVEIKALMRYSESPSPLPPGAIPQGFENKVMHCEFLIGETLLMASDGNSEGTSFSGFSLSLAVSTEAEAKQIFSALAEAGHVTMPIGKTFWSPCFGMLVDRFGMGWMISAIA